MEVSFLKDSSIKIKTKNATIVTNPVIKVQAEVVILTSSVSVFDKEKVEGVKVVISGPGEYEVGGVAITGRDMKGETVYTVSTDSMTVLLLPSSALSKIKEEDEYAAMIIEANADVKDSDFTSFPSNFFIFYGNEAHLPQGIDKPSKVGKINLRKKEDLGGSIFYLG